MVAGGDERSDSVRLALASLPAADAGLGAGARRGATLRVAAPRSMRCWQRG